MKHTTDDPARQAIAAIERQLRQQNELAEAAAVAARSSDIQQAKAALRLCYTARQAADELKGLMSDIWNGVIEG